MRKTLFALAATAVIAGVAFVGCGDDSGVNVGDMAGKTDGPVGTGDMAMVKVGCAGYVQCYIDCFNANPTTATASGCRTMCGKNAKSTASGLFDTALSCGQDHCLGDVDAMNGKCHLMVSGSSGTLINADGTMISNSDPTDGSNPGKDCGRCLNDSLARLFGDMCSLMSSPDCNPTECKAATDACLNDTP
jgi:hypothetical protein